MLGFANLSYVNVPIYCGMLGGGGGGGDRQKLPTAPAVFGQVRLG